jgi:HD domain
MFALMLSEADPTLDVAKIIAMLLIHDIVEIDAGVGRAGRGGAHLRAPAPYSAGQVPVALARI